MGCFFIHLQSRKIKTLWGFSPGEPQGADTHRQLTTSSALCQCHFFVPYVDSWSQFTKQIEHKYLHFSTSSHYLVRPKYSRVIVAHEQDFKIQWSNDACVCFTLMLKMMRQTRLTHLTCVALQVAISHECVAK